MPTTEDRNNAHSSILCIDTSSAQGAIALYDGRTLSSRSWPAERSHTTTLLSEIHHLLEEAAIAVGDLAAIGLAIGPGAFTGLRVGFGVAKGFHLATSVPLISVSTLQAAALPFAVCGNPVLATVSAGRGRLAWARYERGVDRLLETQSPQNGTIEALVAEIQLLGPRSLTVTGELDEEQERLIFGLSDVLLPPRPLRVRQPGALAELAWQQWQQGSLDDVAALEPIYLSR
jgi:tRNA threonylcarbamoyladenosine biosynthesis protein TsaB